MSEQTPIERGAAAMRDDDPVNGDFENDARLVFESIDAAALAEVLKVVLARRIIDGTDWPEATSKEQAEAVKAWLVGDAS